MRQRRAKKGERLRARVSLHGQFDATERKALAAWLRRAAHLLVHDAEYSAIRNFRLYA